MEWRDTIRLWSRIRRLRVAFVVVSVLGVAWLSVPRPADDPARATRPFRVGYQNSPPHQIVGADGKPAGPAIEIFVQAARRLHIPIEWVHVPAGPEQALRSGQVDLWPLIGDL